MAEQPKSAKAAKSKSPKAPKAAKAVKKAKPAAKAPAKKKAVPPTAAPAKPPAEAYFVVMGPAKLEIVSQAPTKSATSFASFEAAKDQAMEQLIELIEDAERQLQVLRRSTSLADYHDQ